MSGTTSGSPSSLARITRRRKLSHSSVQKSASTSTRMSAPTTSEDVVQTFCGRNQVLCTVECGRIWANGPCSNGNDFSAAALKLKAKSGAAAAKRTNKATLSSSSNYLLVIDIPHSAPIDPENTTPIPPPLTFPMFFYVQFGYMITHLTLVVKQL